MNIVQLINKLSGLIKYKFGNLYASFLFKKIGKFCNIHINISVIAPEKIIIGENCEIKQYCILDGRSKEEIGISVGSHTKIKEMVSICSYGGTIILGEYALIGKSAILFGHGNISIGDYSMIGPNTVIISSNYALYNEKGNIPFQEIGFTREKITIGRNVWIGANSSILAGTHIEDNTVIAAGSIVRGNLKGNMIYCGVPASPALSIIGHISKGQIYKKDWGLLD